MGEISNKWKERRKKKEREEKKRERRKKKREGMSDKVKVREE